VVNDIEIIACNILSEGWLVEVDKQKKHIIIKKTCQHGFNDVGVGVIF